METVFLNEQIIKLYKFDKRPCILTHGLDGFGPFFLDLHIQFAIFFKFMQAAISIACALTFFKPRRVVQRMPCFSFISANTRSIVSFLISYISLLMLVCLKCSTSSI